MLDQKTDFEQFLSNLKSKEVLAQGVLDQARHAEAKAIQLQDHTALPIAREAVGLAQQGVAEAQRRVTRQQAKVSVLDRAMHLGPGVTGVTVEARGTVLKQQGGRWVPLQSAGPLQPGEAIRTGRNGTAEVIFRDGFRVVLGPSGLFTMEPVTPQGSLYRLKEGLIHFLHEPGKFFERRYKVRTDGGATVANRGTEFDLRVDARGVTHLVPYDGAVEIAVDPTIIARVNVDRWWEKGKTVASKPLPEGKLLRVAFTQGEVKIEGVDGSSRAAAVGALLANGEKLITGKDGFVQIDLTGGAQGTMAANTRIAITTQGTTEAVRYEIQQGRMHAIGSKETGARPIEISTPNAVLKGQGAEFDVTVNGQGLADIVPLSVTVEVTAQRDKLDVAKLKSWWEEP